jgi:hypothetical protein
VIESCPHGRPSTACDYPRCVQPTVEEAAAGLRDRAVELLAPLLYLGAVACGLLERAVRRLRGRS